MLRTSYRGTPPRTVASSAASAAAGAAGAGVAADAGGGSAAAAAAAAAVAVGVLDLFFLLTKRVNSTMEVYVASFSGGFYFRRFGQISCAPQPQKPALKHTWKCSPVV